MYRPLRERWWKQQNGWGRIFNGCPPPGFTNRSIDSCIQVLRFLTDFVIHFSTYIYIYIYNLHTYTYGAYRHIKMHNLYAISCMHQYMQACIIINLILLACTAQRVSNDVWWGNTKVYMHYTHCLRTYISIWQLCMCICAPPQPPSFIQMDSAKRFPRFPHRQPELQACSAF